MTTADPTSQLHKLQNLSVRGPLPSRTTCQPPSRAQNFLSDNPRNAGIFSLYYACSLDARSTSMVMPTSSFCTGYGSTRMPGVTRPHSLDIIPHRATDAPRDRRMDGTRGRPGKFNNAANNAV
ncbi:hypothetical protein RSAG8_02400, partial [Rhizoctonia solani AG-8 WAC10335]